MTPAGRGKIIGSKKTGQYESKFGPMCEVIILRGMLDGMDIDSELEGSRDGGLMQEIGEECNEKVSFFWAMDGPSGNVQYSHIYSMEPWSGFSLLVMLVSQSRYLLNLSVHCLLYG